VSEQWTSKVSADQPAERAQDVDVVEQADVSVDIDDAVVEVADVPVVDDAVTPLPTLTTQLRMRPRSAPSCAPRRVTGSSSTPMPAMRTGSRPIFRLA